ncbi:MAG: carbon-nitrogen hydrolase family protein, partial [Candidatus Bathyarchaeia archaeon]
LARMGAHFIFSPSAWAVDADHDNLKDPYGKEWEKSYSELCRLYGITIVGVSNVGWIDAGPWKGKKVIGCSLAVGPDGEIIARGPYGHDAEALITIDLQAKPRDVKGTDYGRYLKEKGYQGP